MENSMSLPDEREGISNAKCVNSEDKHSIKQAYPF